MTYKCSICGENDVEYDGDICEECSNRMDPFANKINKQYQAQNTTRKVYMQPSNSNGSEYKTVRKVLLDDTYKNEVRESKVEETKVNEVLNPIDSQIQQFPPKNNNQPITVGVVKNIFIDNQRKSNLNRWFTSLFCGIPFYLGEEITTFQVYPDFSGTILNSMGNACDQVIVFGKIDKGVISENNTVEVIGTRDSKNNIIAKTIINKASGTIINPRNSVSALFVWAVTLSIFFILFLLVASLGISGIMMLIISIIIILNIPLILKMIFGLIALIAITRK